MISRRCPRCKSKDLQDSLVPSKKHAGGRYWAVTCRGCNSLLPNWELIDDYGKTIAITSCESRAVIWRKGAKDRLDRMNGRDPEGMAL